METTKNYYVSMNDTFMSGWGQAKGKIARHIYICYSKEEAEIIKDNAKSRTDQTDIKIHASNPYFNPQSNLLMYKTVKENPNWYKKGFFKKVKEPKDDLKPLKSVGMVAALGEIFGSTKKEKNDWKLRMLKAGLSSKGLSVPEDWDRLSEEDKENRLNGAIAQIS